MLPLLISIPLLAVALVAAIFDFRERRIPNWLTAPAFLAGIAINGLIAGQAGLKSALFGVLIAALIYIPLYALRAIGAGDVKLMVALGAIGGPVTWLALFLATSLAGGIAAVGIVFYRRRMHETWFNLGLVVTNLIHLRVPYQNHPALDVKNAAACRLPHAISIAIGTTAAIVSAGMWSI